MEAIFRVAGPLFWVKKKEALDLPTLVSDLGPAYFFLLAELLAQQAVSVGLEEGITRELIIQALVGSAALASKHKQFTHMIQQVASPGGVTEAALKALEPAVSKTMHGAIDATLKRGKKLHF
ncbi:pyrroline-5-carboxylate reductase family protein [Pajaroellobacter abortibovis]|uniref:Pyrroline-5-carboxylate reductase dimerisation domain-containing protein n=1 Tax=Pajaroellobacter abortibovis TaxID=1882918 RepID=A0A1L6MXB5_9BACT|nr:pyrroline-5-carboxylate reductase dimerization domain-containing protein [Pajaroellobacter abortibovis]APS00099.1 hypothetical protein BCY86_04950 [Pajaroellobacter abortibovis]